MNRRGFLRAIGAAPLALVAVPLLAALPPPIEPEPTMALADAQKLINEQMSALVERMWQNVDNATKISSQLSSGFASAMNVGSNFS